MGASKVGEFFFLREAGRLREQVRQPSEMRQSLLTAVQRRKAAEALWSAGHGAEGLRLMRAALQSAAEAMMAGTGTDELPAALEALQLPTDLASRYDSLLEQSMPALDDELLPAHTPWFGNALKTHAAFTESVDYATLEPFGRRRRQVGRWLGTVALTFSALLVVYWAYERTHRAKVEASGYFNDNPRYAPDLATDANERSEWVLPDRKAGWLDVYTGTARPIRGVRILNGHNAPHNDRAVRGFRVVAFDREGKQKSVQGAFAEFTDHPEWRQVDLVMNDVVRVRLEVHSYFRKGGAVAELVILE